MDSKRKTLLALVCSIAVVAASACGGVASDTGDDVSAGRSTLFGEPDGGAAASATPLDGDSVATPTNAPPADDSRQAPSVDRIVGSTAHKTGKHVALTFDDGPDPRWTPQVLALLEQYEARATFCMVGDNAQRYPGLVRQVAATGNVLCDHTMNHDENLRNQATETQQSEIAGGREAILAAAPQSEVTYYRAPGGNFSLQTRQIAVTLGMQPLAWSVDTRDWTRPGTSAIVAKAKQHLRGSSVVLLHDGGGDRSQSMAALGQLLPWLVAQGYEFDIPA